MTAFSGSFIRSLNTLTGMEALPSFTSRSTPQNVSVPTGMRVPFPSSTCILRRDSAVTTVGKANLTCQKPGSSSPTAEAMKCMNPLLDAVSRSCWSAVCPSAAARHSRLGANKAARLLHRSSRLFRANPTAIPESRRRQGTQREMWSAASTAASTSSSIPANASSVRVSRHLSLFSTISCMALLLGGQ